MRRGSTTTGRSLLALATLVVVVAAGLLGVLRAAPASAAADCVAVIVDFRRLGGSVQTGCAQGDPSNGFQALTKAGFGYAPRPRDGLVCEINASPACSATTTSTYWSYWYRAPRSSTWVYANEGPGTHNPKPGSTEAWVWQDGGRTEPPSIGAATICPQLRASPSPPPKPAATTGSQTPSTKAGTTGAAGRPATVTATPLRTSSQTRTPRPKPTPSPTRSARQTPSPARSATSSPSQISSPSASLTATPISQSSGAAGTTIGTEPTSGSGGALPGGAGLALGAALVVGIGTAAALQARRNRTP